MPLENQRPLGASHVPGGLPSKVALASYRWGQSPWSRQECSGSPAHQPSPLRCDPYGALGLTLFEGVLHINLQTDVQTDLKLLLVVISVVLIVYTALRRVLRCKQEYAIFANLASRETQEKGVAMTVALENLAEIDEQVSQIEEKNRVSSEHLEQISKLEKQVQKHSEPAEIADEINQIKCTVYEANEITQRRDFYLLFKKVEQAISEIEKFQRSYHEPLPKELFNDLRSNLETHKRSLSSLKKTLDLFGNNNGNDPSKTIIKLKKLAFALKGNLELFPYHIIHNMDQRYRELLEEIKQEGVEIIKGKGKPFVPGVKKIQVQIIQALECIVALTEKAKVYVLATQSAEAKAIERIQSTDESTEYITVAELGSTIDLTKLNERLKRRGYNIQIPCEDPPTG